MRSSIVTGNFIVKDERQYEITEIGPKKEIYLKDSITSAKLKYSFKEISDLIFLGQAQVISTDSKFNKLHSDDAMDFHSYPEELKAVARERHLYVKAFEVSGIKGCSNKKPIRELIETVASQNDIEPISWRTLKRYIDAYGEYGVRGLVPSTKKKGNRKSRKSEKLEAFISDALEQFKDSKRPTFAKAYEGLKDRIVIHNHELKLQDTPPDASEYLDSISYQGFINRAKNIAPADLLAAYIGKAKVQTKYRVSSKPDKAYLILDRAEIDHTGGDCIVVDDSSRLPLGRPNATAVLDKRSGSPLGMNIGFEAPSFVSVGRAVKHAISDKTEFLKQFPKVEGDWPCRGAFCELAYDRGAEFESTLLEDALDDLQIAGRGNPAGMPWYKGGVETFFKTINERFLNDTPGKVFSEILDSNEYDPEKNAVISLSEFLESFYVWLVDVYMRSPHGRDKTIPYVVWKQDEPFVDVEPISPKKLDLAFSQNLTRRNNDDGVVYEHIKYDSFELKQLRMQFGNEDVQIKVDREDLSQIQVLHPIDKKFFAVDSTDQEYTQGLTYYQHMVCKRYKAKLAKESTDDVSLAYARRRIKEIIDDAFANTKRVKIAHAKSASRFNDLGQHQVGNNTNMSTQNSTQKPSMPSIPTGDVKPKESNSDFLKRFQNK
ncbi:hypothetical protein [Alteromonas sp. S015]|uniref:hypothetical protein n=1 Tax=Alteromonas sp. S015 TaxID=3117401 RepID=UPI002FE37826